MAPTSLAAQFSVLPEAIEALGVHLCVTGGVVDLAMPEISGEGAGIDALVDQLEPGGVPQQMRVNVAHTDAFGRAAEGLEEPIGAQGRAALAQEYVAGVGRLLPPDASQRADLASGERLSAVIRALAAEQLQSVFVGQKIKGSDRAVRLSPLWLGVLRGWRRTRPGVAWRTIVDRLPKISSHRTPRWREMDSNFRFRAKGATDLSFRFCLCP